VHSRLKKIKIPDPIDWRRDKLINARGGYRMLDWERERCNDTKRVLSRPGLSRELTIHLNLCQWLRPSGGHGRAAGYCATPSSQADSRCS
jgi:hypothetical protein